MTLLNRTPPDFRGSREADIEESCPQTDIYPQALGAVLAGLRLPLLQRVMCWHSLITLSFERQRARDRKRGAWNQER